MQPSDTIASRCIRLHSFGDDQAAWCRAGALEDREADARDAAILSATRAVLAAGIRPTVG